MKHVSARVSVTEQQGCTLVRIDGDINEQFEAAPFVGRRGVVVIDLEGVHAVTSHGVLQWITALRALDADYLGFINCHPTAVDQFNLVDAFAQDGQLLTFYAPYTCTQCEHETQQLVNRCASTFLLFDETAVPAIECPKCGAPAEFDEVPELYFKHALSAPPPRPPAEVRALLGAEQRKGPAERRFEMKKIVTTSVTSFVLSGHLDRAAHFKRAADGVEGKPVIDMAALDAISEDGGKGLRKFLAKLGPEAVLARVPAAMLEPLAEVYAEERRMTTPVVSFLVPLRCTGCEAIMGADVAAERVADLGNPSGRAESCPHCSHPLESQWSEELVARAARLPAGQLGPDLAEYLRAHRPSAAGARLDQFAPTVDPRHLVLGKYKILQLLGRGGMGEVFLAHQVGSERFEKLVVLKRIRRDRLGDPTSVELFLKEARLAAKLAHPNVVQIYDLERLDNEYFISMEYVNGIDLGSALQLSRNARLGWPIEICCRVMAELCEALNAAHTYHDDEGRPAPIVHRDVSPSNILLSTEGEVKLADFGIAGGPDEETDSGVPMFGKHGYAAPEQSAGSTAAPDERTDIYAAGVVLYECVTLRPISRVQTPTVPAAKWVPNSPPQIVVARSAAPPLLQDVFERAVQPEPDQRYRSARDFGRDLDRIGRMVGEASREDLALWIRRLVALRRESDANPASPVVTMETGIRLARPGLGVFELGRGQ